MNSLLEIGNDMGGFIGPVLGTVGAATGIAVVGTAANVLANETELIVPNAKKTLEKQKG